MRRPSVALLGLLIGVGAGCFAEPSPDVSFACSVDDEKPCPDGYRCEDDGCCHAEGSDVAANRGACSLTSAFETGDGESTSETG
jgi:hypothetical protein